jgi:phage shock protein PspC (stress-responsive transcriptional regulator)
MKKTVNINLGGYALTIDEDAYIYLKRYLNTIERHFSKSEGCSDIMTDIEIRITELFHENLMGRQIISMPDLKEVIKIMGKPEDFGAEPLIEDSPRYTKRNANREPLITTGKKLYRDKEHGMLAGVISGLCAYFGIKNPLILRILWLLFAMSGGAGVVVYLVLWAVVPEATSASDKLAMKGEPINVENIAKTIEEEIEDLSQKINDLSNGLSRKRKKKDDSSTEYNNEFSV